MNKSSGKRERERERNTRVLTLRMVMLTDNKNYDDLENNSITKIKR